ncbi:hypothetical protein Cgig2_007264 [Carnegiea gigantea]|uniref:Gnk2-homologous domain-containing protein n=1 Tax=Carnegiea gigantea TaxID=171969 RepID=A0A9Q1KVQ8_9CARY|nr:hypothetical protein Cgig2_007264 [Carnegiea gigantea]
MVPHGHYCNPHSSIPTGSPVSANIKNVLAAMTRASQLENLFSGFSSGVGENTVYGLANCRGDLNIRQYCIPCIQDAVQQIQKICLGKSDAQIWYDYCIVRYSRENFFGTFDGSRLATIRNPVDYRDPPSLFSRLGPLFRNIINRVVDPANTGMVKAQTVLPSGVTLYGGALCTRDLRPVGCTLCLYTAVRHFDSFCKPKQGCRVFLSSCFVRYEIYRFTASLDAGFKKIPGQAIEKLIGDEFGQAKQVHNYKNNGYISGSPANNGYKNNTSDTGYHCLRK